MKIQPKGCRIIKHRPKVNRNKIARRKSKYYVYILECGDGTYYTGYTNNLEKRVKLHNKGKGAKYVRGRGPVKLVYCKEHKYYKNALNEERRIKKMRKENKQELIRNYENNKTK